MKKIFTLLSIAFLGNFGHAQVIALPVFATGLSNPVEIVNAGDVRLFVVEQSGKIQIVNPDGTKNTTPFLTMPSGVVSVGGEKGLLGLAFHPDYVTNRFFYVNYTRAGDGATVIARYQTMLTNPNIADPTSALVILTIAQPYSNHNGGGIKFAADGFLYIGTGDGGSAGDPQNRAQNINENLGKMLRIDVDTTDDSLYQTPPSNPFVGVAGNDEIWAVGLRNPWKYSFDRETGDLWIADVGQSQIEEINHVVPTPGLNFGWKCYEGNNTYSTGCSTAPTYTFPVAFYNHSVGCSITGGYVYRGTIYPNMFGKYFFSDYCSNFIGMVNVATNGVTYANFSGGSSWVTFGQDVNGELYIADVATGKIHKVIDSSLAVDDFAINGFSLVPNPAKEYFTIKTAVGRTLSSVSVFDITGKRLIYRNVSGNENTISTDGLQTGMYIVEVKDNAENASRTKLMVK